VKLGASPTARRQIIEALRTRSAFDRDDGVTHGSDVQFCLLKGAMRKYVHFPESEEDTLIFAAGRGYEEVLQALRQFHMLRHELIERDGIVFTPDLTDIAPGISKIVEIKSTRKSARRFNEADSIPDLFMRMMEQSKALGNYLDQAKTYCAASRIPRAEIDILCIMGDYDGNCQACIQALIDTGSSLPQHQHGMATLHCYEAEWTEQELEDWWNHRVMLRYENYQLVSTAIRELPAEEWAGVIVLANEGQLDVTVHELLGLKEHPFEQIVGYPFECELCPILKICRPPHMEALVAVMDAGKRTVDAPLEPYRIEEYKEMLLQQMVPKIRMLKHEFIPGEDGMCQKKKGKGEVCGKPQEHHLAAGADDAAA
jgi:hypothetical protein